MKRSPRTKQAPRPIARSIYFLVVGQGEGKIVVPEYSHVLMPITSIKTRNDLATVKQWCASGITLLVDSGVFELCAEHARNHNVALTDALKLAPEEIDGFAELWDHYVKIGREINDGVLAMVEIDLGGKKRKRETRAALEREGLKVAPVFHPILDGWDYLDELAEKYKFILCGNVVDANKQDRLGVLSRLLAWKRKHPDVWVHLLGVTPSPMSVAFPMDSTDSSAWLSSTRQFSAWKAMSLYDKVGPFGRDMAYVLEGGDNASYVKTKRLTAIQFACQAHSLTHYHSHFEFEVE